MKNYFQLSTHRKRLFVICATAAMFAFDMYEEIMESPKEFEIHHVFEFAVFLGVVWLLWREIDSIRELRRALHYKQEQVERLSGELARHIDLSFDCWNLTPAEKEVAWLLVKGFSFVEMSELRKVKEKTLRQQAMQIYAKGKVKGRSELAALFVEDLLSGTNGTTIEE